VIEITTDSRYESDKDSTVLLANTQIIPKPRYDASKPASHSIDAEELDTEELDVPGLPQLSKEAFERIFEE
jgi:hypothetical protein